MIAVIQAAFLSYWSSKLIPNVRINTDGRNYELAAKKRPILCGGSKSKICTFSVKAVG
jgi:hypothetical protein